MFRARPRLDINRDSFIQGDADLRQPSLGATNQDESRPGTRSRICSKVTSLTDKDSTGTDCHQVDKFSLKQLARSYATRGIYGRSEVKTNGSDSLNSKMMKGERGNSSRVGSLSYVLRKSEIEDSFDDEVLQRPHLRDIEPSNLCNMNKDLSGFNKLSLSNKNEDQENKNSYMDPQVDCSHETFSQHHSSSSRTVTLSDFPPMTVDLTSILAQTCGGPIERITVTSKKSNKQGDWESKLLNLSFFKVSDAEKFQEFASTGMFMVNGMRIPVDFQQENQNERLSESVKGEMSNKGARRCLVLKKQTTNKPKSLSHLGAPRTVLAELDAAESRRDFSKFGQIVEIAAVISKRVSFAVHYYDTRSAIKAKLELETPGTELNEKYAEWNVWYGKDPCDRPCYSI